MNSHSLHPKTESYHDESYKEPWGNEKQEEDDQEEEDELRRDFTFTEGAQVPRSSSFSPSPSHSRNGSFVFSSPPVRHSYSLSSSRYHSRKPSSFSESKRSHQRAQSVSIMPKKAGTLVFHKKGESIDEVKKEETPEQKHSRRKSRSKRWSAVFEDGKIVEQGSSRDSVQKDTQELQIGAKTLPSTDKSVSPTFESSQIQSPFSRSQNSEITSFTRKRSSLSASSPSVIVDSEHLPSKDTQSSPFSPQPKSRTSSSFSEDSREKYTHSDIPSDDDIDEQDDDSFDGQQDDSTVVHLNIPTSTDGDGKQTDWEAKQRLGFTSGSPAMYETSYPPMYPLDSGSGMMNPPHTMYSQFQAYSPPQVMVKPSGIPVSNGSERDKSASPVQYSQQSQEFMDIVAQECRAPIGYSDPQIPSPTGVVGTASLDTDSVATKPIIPVSSPYVVVDPSSYVAISTSASVIETDVDRVTLPVFDGDSSHAADDISSRDDTEHEQRQQYEDYAVAEDGERLVIPTSVVVDGSVSSIGSTAPISHSLISCPLPTGCWMFLLPFKHFSVALSHCDESMKEAVLSSEIYKVFLIIGLCFLMAFFLPIIM
ncbi:hypothetical protein ADUPG1_008199 [Aduncisulcus paluster]|uniref:Uncharacterized protein n=1 Tax=Aduncisulcus paluster TaxID=2918883 RepID=A0ABQ5KR39_9EUKA|nr:hypothetical protein ADUPG1_008199 [Aduncisulcus paluster]